MSNLIKGFNAVNVEPLLINSDETDIARRINEEVYTNQLRMQVSEPDEDGFSAGLYVSELSEEELTAAMGANQQDILDSYEPDVELAHEAALVVQEAYAESEEILHNARMEAEDIKAQAAAQGKKEGYQQGMADADAEIQHLKEQMANEQRQMQEQLLQEQEQYLESLEPQFTEVLCNLLERLTGVVVTGHKEVILYLINNAMRGIDNCHSFVISVSEQDYSYVEQHKEQIYGYLNPGMNIELFQDSKLNKNQCKIETEGGLVDLSLDVQMSQMIKTLMMLNE